MSLRPQSLAGAYEIIDRLQRERDEAMRNNAELGIAAVEAMGERDEQRTYAENLKRAADGVGAWLLHRFGPNSPEGREGEALLRATLPKNPNPSGRPYSHDSDSGSCGTVATPEGVVGTGPEICTINEGAGAPCGNPAALTGHADQPVPQANAIPAPPTTPDTRQHTAPAPSPSTFPAIGNVEEDDDAIKPCPCCGSPAAVQQVERGKDRGGYYIECGNPACALTTNLIFASMDDPVPILCEKWNRRTFLSQSQAETLYDPGVAVNGLCLNCGRSESEHYIPDVSLTCPAQDSQR